MGKFKEVFNEPVLFTENVLVISGEYSIVQAAAEFSRYIGEKVSIDRIKKDRVRFGFFRDDFGEFDEHSTCWGLGASDKKGSKPVWVMEWVFK